MIIIIRFTCFSLLLELINTVFNVSLYDLAPAPIILSHVFIETSAKLFI